MADSVPFDPAETAINQCLNLQSDESCAIVTDDNCLEVANALYDAAAEITDDVLLLRYSPGEQHGEEPPDTVANIMKDVDVALAPTTKSLSHTNARIESTTAGTRLATLPGITESVFRKGMDADYDRILEESERLLDQLSGAEKVQVKTPHGTDITIHPGSREWLADTGIIHEAGGFTNLPTGEVFISPESADGTVVVDGTMSPYGRLEDGQTIEFTIQDGYVTEIDGEELRDAVEEAAKQVGDAAYNVAEFGIGTNVGVTELVGSVLLDEKAGGTVHIAIGDDHGIGGDVEAPIHLDGILTEPTVYIDGKKVTLPTSDA